MPLYAGTKYDIVLNHDLRDGGSENGKYTTPCNDISPEEEERGRSKNIVGPGFLKLIMRVIIDRYIAGHQFAEDDRKSKFLTSPLAAGFRGSRRATS